MRERELEFELQTNEQLLEALLRSADKADIGKRTRLESLVDGAKFYQVHWQKG